MKRILILIAMFFVAFMNIRVLFCKARISCVNNVDLLESVEKILYDFRISDAWSELSAQQLLNLLNQQREIVDLIIERNSNLSKNIQSLEMLEHQSMPMVKHVYNAIMNVVTTDMVPSIGKTISKQVHVSSAHKKQYLKEIKKNLAESFNVLQKMQYEYAINGLMSVAKTNKKTTQKVATTNHINNVRVYNSVAKLSGNIKDTQQSQIVPSKLLCNIINKHINDLFITTSVTH